MSKTRRRKEDPTKDFLARLAALVATAITLIQKGARSDQMIKTLLEALHLFKHKRLAGVVSIGKRSENNLSENFQELLSMTVSDLPLDKRAKKYFLDNGAWYLGEAMRFLPAKDSHTPKAVKVMQEYVIELGLPPDLKPLEAGWRPPYWDDPVLLKVLNKPLIEEMQDKKQAMHFHRHYNITYLGELISKQSRKFILRRPDRVQHFLLGSAEWYGMHAMMYLPPNWEPPKELPPSLKTHLDAEYLREEERQRKFLEEERAAKEATQCFRVSDIALLFRSIEDLELSVRATNALRNAEFVYLGDLVACTSAVLMMRSRHIGRKSIRECINALASLNLTLGMDPAEHLHLGSYLRWRDAESAWRASQSQKH